MMPLFDSVADALASDGYAIADQFLSQKEVNDVVSLEKFKNDNFKKAGIGKKSGLQVNEAIRGDYIQWVDKKAAPAAIQVYLDKLGALISFLNESLFLSLKDFEVHMTVYPTGTFYKRHIDQFKLDDHRKLSVICYLNNDWQQEHGGQLRIFLENGPRDI